ncbi:MAG: tail fiber domain-containing protein [Bacteroidetes bacterium]|nr:tail fiber domain-containing protein [Bacteroidota bacterium]
MKLKNLLATALLIFIVQTVWGQWTDDGTTVRLDNPSDNVGIGTSSPVAKLHIAEGGLLIEGATGSTPVSGAGDRLMWIPDKKAFRAGGVGGIYWNDWLVGEYSFAAGYNAKAKGKYSISLGYNTQADGQYSVAMGHETRATANYATAIGGGTIASSTYTFAAGYMTEASGAVSVAMGQGGTTASGIASVAIGSHVFSSGNYTTVIGSYAESSGEGSFMIADHSTTTPMTKRANNRFSARFANGYQLFTDMGASIGVRLPGGAHSWSSISDSTKKENFTLVDGEEILNKISAFELGTWNYITQDKSTFRHYGPMAQDFFAAFGSDAIGTIGNDTLIASADFDGINFIAIQALEKRTTELNAKMKELERVQADLVAMKEILDQMEASLQKLGL